MKSGSTRTGTPSERPADLRSLSDTNYRRHRGWRYASALVGCATLVGLVAVGVEGLWVAVPLLLAPSRYFTAACLGIVGYLCFTLAWIPYRFLAPPPIGITVNRHELVFLNRTGKRTKLRLDRGAIWMELLERTGPSVPREAAYRLWLIRGDIDYALAWRRITPLTYLTATESESIRKAAEAAGLSIH